MNRFITVRVTFGSDAHRYLIDTLWVQITHCMDGTVVFSYARPKNTTQKFPNKNDNQSIFCHVVSECVHGIDIINQQCTDCNDAWINREYR